MKSKIAKYLIFFTITVILLYFSFSGVEWDDFISGLHSCNFRWILLSMTVSIAAFVFRAARWRLLMIPLDKSITFRESFDGINIGNITNFALPRAGEFARCGVISKTGKAKFESVLGSVVIERVFDMVTLAVIFTTLFFLKWDDFGLFMEENILGPLSGKFGKGFMLAIAICAAAGIAALWLMKKHRKRLSENFILGRLYRAVDGLKSGLYSGIKMESRWAFLLYTAMIWTCYWMMSFCTIMAFPAVATLSGEDALFLMIAGSLGWVVPVQGGIGAYHFIVSLALSSVYGINHTDGIIFATISHTSQAITMIAGGIWSIASMALYARKTL